MSWLRGDGSHGWTRKVDFSAVHTLAPTSLGGVLVTGLEQYRVGGGLDAGREATLVEYSGAGKRLHRLVLSSTGRTRITALVSHGRDIYLAGVFSGELKIGGRTLRGIGAKGTSFVAKLSARVGE